MKKTAFFAFLMSFATAMAFTSCGDDDKDDPDDPVDPTPTFVYNTVTINGVDFQFANVAGGTFTMGGTADQGSDAYENEFPTHQVTLNTFFIGKTEVTQAQWKAVMGKANNPSKFVGDNLPVDYVSWEDCKEFITKLNKMSSHTFRLPTEAEWEFAARGGIKSKGYRYSGSNNISEVAWYSSPANPLTSTHEVATLKPNEIGLYDMSGNLNEWCNDEWSDYTAEAQVNPKGPSTGSATRIRRGGCWENYYRVCRVAYRGQSGLKARSNTFGFRLVLDK